jgi:aminoglycoside phosphotransferase (APT) family kinase protein
MTASKALDEPAFVEKLIRAVRRRFGDAADIRPVGEPSMGGINHTAIFDIEGPGGAGRRLVLRRETYAGTGNPFLPSHKQYRLLEVAHARNLPVPEPVFELDASDGLGRGFVMGFVEGETLPRRINGDPRFDAIRPGLAARCGELLAAIHDFGLEATDFLADVADTADPLAAQRERLDLYREPHPALELGLRWLELNRPGGGDRVSLHGDFRNGNFIVNDSGVAAILDWECSHHGRPMEDLGWLCVPSWRFGNLDRPVGGFGERADLYAAYEAASGRRVDDGEVRYWEIFGMVRWAILNVMQGFGHVHEGRRSMVWAACGRNVAMVEHELMQALAGRGPR